MFQIKFKKWLLYFLRNFGFQNLTRKNSDIPKRQNHFGTNQQLAELQQAQPDWVLKIKPDYLKIFA